MNKTLIKENLIKNLLVIICAAFGYGFIVDSVGGVDVLQSGNLFSIISMLLVVVCFANFAFTYEKSKMNSLYSRLLSHACTFILFLLLAYLLIALVTSVKVFMPSLNSLTIWFSVLIYVAVVLYDFWDVLRFRE